MKKENYLLLGGVICGVLFMESYGVEEPTLVLSDPSTINKAATDFFTKAHTLVKGPISTAVAAGAAVFGGGMSMITMRFGPFLTGGGIAAGVKILSNLL